MFLRLSRTGRTVRQHREKTFATRMAAVHRHAQQIPNPRSETLHVFSSNPLQFKASASAAVRPQRKSKRHGTGAKSMTAPVAPPWAQTCYATSIVLHTITLGALTQLATTLWADQTQGSETMRGENGRIFENPSRMQATPLDRPASGCRTLRFDKVPKKGEYRSVVVGPIGNLRNQPASNVRRRLSPAACRPPAPIP
jgi:hypothetical protein